MKQSVNNLRKIFEMKDDGESQQIIFENGDIILIYHEPDCCEWNYADL